MAYAMLAGLPSEMGLYASILLPIVYTLIGSSRALAVGPVAVAALMVANALSTHYGNESSEAAFTGAMILAAETGVLLLMMGAFRVGTLVSFISHPVLSGFTSGAAILIVTSQLKHLSRIDSMHLAEVKGPVMNRLRHTFLREALSDKRIHLSAKHAWNALGKQTHEGWE